MAHEGPNRERVTHGKIALKGTKSGGKLRAGLFWIWRQRKVFRRRERLPRVRNEEKSSAGESPTNWQKGDPGGGTQLSLLAIGLESSECGGSWSA